MPSVPLHVSPVVSSFNGNPSNPLPPVLQTPAGLAIIEIQGSLHTPPVNIEAGTTDIGRLVFPLYDPQAAAEDVAWMRKVHLYVGRHQRLTGEVKKLGKGKAIGIVQKKEGGSVAEEEEGLEIVDVVRYKILFQGRPEPVDMAVED
jgi:chromosome transmission fidelity protein 8